MCVFVYSSCVVYFVMFFFGFGFVVIFYGIFVMWFLAFYMGLSKPIDPDRVERVAKSLI